MGRLSKAAGASRTNGGQAKNKGKAKLTVPVLTCGYNDESGGYEYHVENRTKLPKGCVAYSSEVAAYAQCINDVRGTGRSPDVHILPDRAVSVAPRRHLLGLRSDDDAASMAAKEVLTSYHDRYWSN